MLTESKVNDKHDQLQEQAEGKLIMKSVARIFLVCLNLFHNQATSHTQVAETKVKCIYYPSYMILTSELQYEIYLIL